MVKPRSTRAWMVVCLLLVATTLAFSSSASAEWVMVWDMNAPFPGGFLPVLDPWDVAAHHLLPITLSPPDSLGRSTLWYEHTGHSDAPPCTFTYGPGVLVTVTAPASWSDPTATGGLTVLFSHWLVWGGQSGGYVISGDRGLVIDTTYGWDLEPYYDVVAPTHELHVEANCSPSTVDSEGTTTCLGSATDGLGHAIATWAWDDGGAGGTFSSTSAQNPTYTAPPNGTSIGLAITLTVTATCEGPWPATATGSTSLTVLPAGPVSPIEIVRARMVSDHELGVLSARRFAGQAGYVSLSMEVNGTPIVTPEQLLVSNVGPDGQLLTEDWLLVDFRAAQVPRFTSNQRFTVTARARFSDTSYEASKEMVVLLPVVIVPGILNGKGGDGIYPKLEEFLASTSAAEYGDDCAYAVQSGSAAYPTVYTLAYATNTDSFAVGAQHLRDLLQGSVFTKTYASRVNLLTQSKGGLVARQFLRWTDGQASVSRLIMCAPPNLGSVWARLEYLWQTRPDKQVSGWANLYPTWPWFRSKASGLFKVQPQNRELATLDDVSEPLPSSIPYTIIYSDSEPTPDTYSKWALVLGQDPCTYSPGDGIVPAESALGVWRDRNMPSAAPPYIIKQFDGVSIEHVQLAGGHVGYIEQGPVDADPGHGDVMSAIYSRLVQDLAAGGAPGATPIQP